MILAKRSLEFFPVQFFAVIMGISGLTIAFAKAYHVLNFPKWIYLVLLFLDTFLFFFIFTTYIIKWVKYPNRVKEELVHPIKSSFFSAITISFLLISIAYYDFAPTVSIIFWVIAAPIHLIVMILTFKFWITHDKFKINHINPAWFIPVVGNVLVPVVGIDVMPVEVSIFYLAVGLFFWLVLFTIVFYRMIFHDPMPLKLIPTLFILIAPPAVGFISYYRITFGSIDMFSQILYSIALITTILIFAKIDVFKKVPFFISWWAYTFPLAAITIATILIYMAYRNSFFMYCLSLLLLFITTAVICYVFYKTLIAIKNYEICKPE